MAGPNLADLFTGNQGRKFWFFSNNTKNLAKATSINNNNASHKHNNRDKNLKKYYPKNDLKTSENIMDKRNFINRNLIFFCSNMNRHAGFFQNYPIIQNDNWAYIKKISEIIVERKSLSRNKMFICQNFIEKTAEKLKKINYDKMIGIHCCFCKFKFKSLTEKTQFILSNKKSGENDKGFFHYFQITMRKKIEIDNIFIGLYGLDTSYDNVFKFLKAVLLVSFDSNIIGKDNFKELISSF